ncbi:hypothetical protein [Streptomyces sp. NPDC001970]
MRINARWVAAAAVFAAVTGVTTGSVAASAATPGTSSPAADRQDQAGAGADGEGDKGKGCVVIPEKLTEEERARLKEKLEKAREARNESPAKLTEEERAKLRDTFEEVPKKLRELTEEERARVEEKIRKAREVAPEKLPRLIEEQRTTLREKLEKVREEAGKEGAQGPGRKLREGLVCHVEKDGTGRDGKLPKLADALTEVWKDLREHKPDN